MAAVRRDKRVTTRNTIDVGHPLKSAKVVPLKVKTMSDKEREKQAKKKKQAGKK